MIYPIINLILRFKKNYSSIISTAQITETLDIICKTQTHLQQNGSFFIAET